MKCATEKELLLHLANSLPGQRAELLEQHLTTCERCSKAHAEFASMTKRLAPDSGEFDDPELVDDVMRPRDQHPCAGVVGLDQIPDQLHPVIITDARNSLFVT